MPFFVSHNDLIIKTNTAGDQIREVPASLAVQETSTTRHDEHC